MNDYLEVLAVFVTAYAVCWLFFNLVPFWEAEDTRKHAETLRTVARIERERRGDEAQAAHRARHAAAVRSMLASAGVTADRT